MELELERTFLLKYPPKGLKECRFVEITDIYIPEGADHPILRIRKRGDVFEITKKAPIAGNDSSEQEEDTISLFKEEFEYLSNLEGKRFRKIRYFFPYNDRIAEIDIFKDQREGIALVGFEFETKKEKDEFEMPEFCLADVTQEKVTAGGCLAGKSYSNIEPFLNKYKYKKIIL